MADDAEFLVHFSRTLHISLPRADASVAALKRQLQAREGVPAELVELYADGKRLLADALVPRLPALVRARLDGGLRGGKGGFGAMLRSSGRGAGAKATTNFGACRDLNGRRLRHVNQDVAVHKWRADSAAREQRRQQGVSAQEVLDDETPSGIPGWYLATPSWADGVKRSHAKRRRNTALCRHWAAARADGRAPPAGAPRWWGCPRGRDCDFAHGEHELRGAALTALKREARERAQQQQQHALARYVAFEADAPDDVAAALRMGLRKRRAAALLQSPLGGSDDDSSTDDDNVDDDDDDNDDGGWLEPVAASVGVAFRRGVCELRGASNFGTARARCRVAGGGRWYFEVRVVSAGVAQLGWADGAFAADSAAGDGVGDHARSWAFDGARALAWSGGEARAFGAAWAPGDVVGCLLDVDAREVAFSRNGEALGAAFTGVTGTGFFPAVSLEEGEVVLVNLGARQPFLFAPDGARPAADALVREGDEGGEDGGERESAGANDKETRKAEAEAVETVDNKAKTDNKAQESEQEAPPIDLSAVETPEELERLGLDALKRELQRRGLKCGGSLAERAQRLLSVRGKSWDEIEKKLKDPRAAPPKA